MVVDALIIAAPEMFETPLAKMASENDALAIVAPAVAEAVAALIKAPVIGASKIPPPLHPAKRVTITSLMTEALITPAIVPVPMSKTAMPDIVFNP